MYMPLREGNILKVIWMGKYFVNEDRTDPTIVALYCVANEVAELNRLKRIELESMVMMEEIRTTPENLDKFSKDLEDRA